VTIGDRDTPCHTFGCRWQTLVTGRVQIFRDGGDDAGT
jgi:hypothetical protein